MFCSVMHQDDRTVTKVLVIKNAAADLLGSVVLPVETGYSFRWKRDMEKRDGCGVINERNIDLCKAALYLDSMQ